MLENGLSMFSLRFSMFLKKFYRCLMRFYEFLKNCCAARIWLYKVLHVFEEVLQMLDEMFLRCLSGFLKNKWMKNDCTDYLIS